MMSCPLASDPPEKFREADRGIDESSALPRTFGQDRTDPRELAQALLVHDLCAMFLALPGYAKNHFESKQSSRNFLIWRKFASEFDGDLLPNLSNPMPEPVPG